MLPQLIEEDMREIDGALGDLLTKSEATSALVLDKVPRPIVGVLPYEADFRL